MEGAMDKELPSERSLRYWSPLGIIAAIAVVAAIVVVVVRLTTWLG
jgi:hypothetical protein